MTAERDEPTLTRVGGGRSGPLVALLAISIVAASLVIALADRPSDPAPVPTLVAGSPTPTPTLAPTPTPSASATASATASAVPAGAFLLATLSSGEQPVVRHALGGPSEPSAFIDVPPEMWRDAPRLSLGWVGGDTTRRHVELVAVRLSLASGQDPGLPIAQAAGRLLLPGPVAGTVSWSYRVVIDRAHRFSHPHEWAVVVEMTAHDDGRGCERKDSPWVRGDC